MQLIVQAPECRQQSAPLGTKNMGFGEKNRNIVEGAHAHELCGPRHLSPPLLLPVKSLFQRLRNQEAENKDLRKQVRRLEKKADRLSKNNADLAAKISHLEDRLEQAHRLLSGKKSERYTPADKVQQGRLFGEEPVAVEPEEGGGRVCPGKAQAAWEEQAGARADSGPSAQRGDPP